MMILFFFLTSLQYFITQGMGQSSMFLTFHTVCNYRGKTWASGRVGGGVEEWRNPRVPYLCIMKPV